MQALVAATRAHAKKHAISGVFEEVVNINGFNITVRGNVVGGEVKIGTAFIEG